MAHLTRTISKMFVILVMLFGNPPLVRLRDLARRPAVALVAAAPPPPGEGPLLLPRPATDTRDGRRYIPVDAA